MKKSLILLLTFALVGSAAAFESVKNEAPIVIPAKSETVYNKLWVQSVMISAPAPTQKANAVVMLVAWDGGANILEGSSRMVRINDIFGVAQTDTEMAAAINAVIKIADKYK